MKLFGGKDEKPPRPKVDFSNVESGASSTAPPPAPAAPVPIPAAHESYVIQKGDTLWKIAKKFYGKGSRWPRIHEANREAIPNPDLIHPGVELRIPKD